MNIFDSHLHLNHPDFEGKEEQAWKEARDSGVSHGVVIGYDIESSKKAVALAESFEGLYASVGVSPHDYLKAPAQYLDQIKTIADHPKVKAIGEAGLEYHYPAGPKETQIEYFTQQAELAEELKKPLVIHLRDADHDFLQLMDHFPASNAILHCFTASETVMQKAVALGFYISFSGIVTFKNAKEIQRIASKVPDAQILVETDAPYLAPTPYREKPCEPKMIVETVKKLAEIRGQEIDEIRTRTSENAKHIFQIR